MSSKKGIKQQSETPLATGEVNGAGDTYAPRRLTFAENVILTIKVLSGFGLLGAALWGIDLWTAAK